MFSRSGMAKRSPSAVMTAAVVGSRAGITTVSAVPSTFFQEHLQRLPIPEVDDSLKKYLRSVSAIQSEAEHAATKAAAAAFVETGVANRLQQELIARDNADPQNSFINPFWDHMYFSDRSPLPINVNPFLQLNDDPRGGEMEKQAVRAAALVHSAAHMALAIKNGTLSPESFPAPKTDDFYGSLALKAASMLPLKAPVQGQWLPLPLLYAYANQVYPLDMSQHERLFGTTRLPQQGKDVMHRNPDADTIAVMANNHVYTLRVIENGQPRHPDIIASSLAAIKDHASKQARGPAVGVLTTDQRDTWASARARLEGNSTNAASLKAVDDALFVLSLDDVAYETLTEASCQFLHGTPANRWFDKSFNMIVDSRGKTAVNFEHSWGDGVCVLRMVNEIYADTVAMSTVPNASAVAPEQAEVNQLQWELSSDDKKAIDSAAARIGAQIDSLDFQTMFFDDFGKKALKSAKVSPDGIVQLAIQLAYRNQWGQACATYESASTAAFRRGRTETIRPCTPESVAFTLAMNNSSETDVNRVKLLRTAVKAHEDNKLACSMGKGFDRHLFALKNLAGDMDGELPALFTDPGYAKINHNILSTSTLVSDAIEGGGFGPVVADGYGVGYGQRDNEMLFNITSYGRDTSKFLENIASSLHAIRDLLDRTVGQEGDEKK